MWQVVLEAEGEVSLPAGLSLLFEDQLETGRRLLLLDGAPEAFARFLKGLPAETLVSARKTEGELMRLPSGLRIKCFGKPGPQEIVLKARGAFGSGLHPTTRLSLHLLDRFLLEEGPGFGLDLGAGTGVLSLVAARRGARMVALDIDLQAVQVAWENALTNSLAPYIYPVAGGLEAVKGPFDFVVANLYLRLLVPEARKIKALAPQGTLILSGFFREALPQIVNAYGREPEHVVSEEGWAAVLLRFTP